MAPPRCGMLPATKLRSRLNAYNCTHYHIQNGKIARVQVYISDQYTVDNFFCAVYRYKPIPDRLAD